MQTPSSPSHGTPPPASRTEELRSVLFLSIVMAPVLAVIAVAGYGFVVWMVQLFSGPPGS